MTLRSALLGPFVHALMAKLTKGELWRHSDSILRERLSVVKAELSARGER